MYPLSAGIITESKELWEELSQALQKTSTRVLFELPAIPDNWSDFVERLERTRPELLIIEVTNLRDSLSEVVRRIRATSAHPVVFALHRTASPDAILAALRAGVSEFLYPPLEDPLKFALEKLARARENTESSAGQKGNILAFVSAKGGCGATTVACHTAADLAQITQEKVLLADLDLQTGLVGFLTKAKNTYSIADAAGNLQRLDQSYWKALVSNGIPNLEVITAPTMPSEKDVAPASLKQVVAFARTLYSRTVIDLGRNLNRSGLSVLELADEIYLVTTCEIPALHQAKMMVAYLLHHGFQESKLRLVLNRVPKRSDITLEEFSSMLGLPVYYTLPEDPDDLQESYASGKLLNPGSPLGRSLHDMAAKIAGVETTKKKRFSLFG